MKKIIIFFKKKRFFIFLFLFFLYNLESSNVSAKTPVKKTANKKASVKKTPVNNKNIQKKMPIKNNQIKTTDAPPSNKDPINQGPPTSDKIIQNKDIQTFQDGSTIAIDPKDIVLHNISVKNQTDIRKDLNETRLSLLALGSADENFIGFLKAYNILAEETGQLNADKDVSPLSKNIKSLDVDIMKIIDKKKIDLKDTKDATNKKDDANKNKTIEKSAVAFVNIEKATTEWLKNSLNKALVANTICNYYFFQLVLKSYDPKSVHDNLSDITNLIKLSNKFLTDLDLIINNFISKKETIESTINKMKAWLKKTNILLSLSSFNIVEKGDNIIITFNKSTASPVVVDGTTLKGGFLLQADFQTIYSHATLCHDSGSMVLFFYRNDDNSKIKDTDILKNVKTAITNYNNNSNRTPIILTVTDMAISKSFLIQEVPETDDSKNKNKHPGFLTINFKKEKKILPYLSNSTNSRSFNYGRNSENIVDDIRYLIGVDIDLNTLIGYIKKSLNNLKINIFTEFTTSIFNPLQQKTMMDNLKIYDKILKQADPNYIKNLDTSAHVQLIINKLQENKTKDPMNADQIDRAINALNIYKNSKK